MDEKDHEILNLLEENGRLPLRELATSLALPEDEVEERIRAMEEARIIRRFNAVIDWERAGNSRVSAIIDLKIAPERDFGYEQDRRAPRAVPAGEGPLPCLGGL